MQLTENTNPGKQKAWLISAPGMALTTYREDCVDALKQVVAELCATNLTNVSVVEVMAELEFKSDAVRHVSMRLLGRSDEKNEAPEEEEFDPFQRIRRYLEPKPSNNLIKDSPEYLTLLANIKTVWGDDLPEILIRKIKHLYKHADYSEDYIRKNALKLLGKAIVTDRVTISNVYTLINSNVYI